ncbi:MAG: lysylphosphatidylglycerol synthase transmembrane domain-containing protein [Candidatus Paceibacterota bacterium]
MIKILLLFLLSIIFGGILFFYVGNIIGFDFILNSFKVFLSLEGLIIIALSFLIAYLGALRWKKILGNEKVSNKEIFKIYIGGFSLMYFFPMALLGSEFFRASLLKHKGVKWENALASVFIERVVEWTVNIIVILIGVLYFFYAIQIPSQKFAMLFAGLILFALLILSFIYFYVFKKKSFLRKVLHKEESLVLKVEKIVFNFFRLSNIDLWRSYFYSILKVLAMLLRVWLIILFLGKILLLNESFSILSFSFLSTLIPVPAALGVQELLQVFVFENLNISLMMSSMFSMLLRAGDVIVSVLGFVLFFKVIYDFLKRKFCKNEK